MGPRSLVLILLEDSYSRPNKQTVLFVVLFRQLSFDVDLLGQ